MLDPALIADLRHRPWHHVLGPVSEEESKHDRDRCAAIADGDARGREEGELRYWVTYFECLQKSGYEPDYDESGR
jgi:hypothetical protein